MTRKLYRLLGLLLLVLPVAARAQVQPDTSTLSKPRLIAVGAGFGAAYTATLVSLNKAWYTGDRTDFHFFDDSHEWRNMDKAGHFWGAFQQSRVGIDMLRWAGVPEQKAILYGGLTGILLQTPIEIFDGYQPEYGASVSDVLANTAGAAAVVAQQLAWHDIRIMPKFSFHTTRYAAVRPNVLGSELHEQILKDYNGQTYWLSADIGAFLKPESKYPKWLSIAVGYGAEEMVYNHEPGNEAAGFQAHRQYYLSPDLNLMHFRGRSKVLNTALYILSMIKVPAPALEYNRQGGLKLHPLYF
ncbi:DUF2279 domain-containing protein [Pontibacter russatus]|uniref:DUF2279 domain-containing protein n=1 Tax=Pontibacter russatus TaxID=2694929 RepID=UPI001379FAB2|nr:DUF2279 domain-containing protein [Pontibacter russatus]